MEGGGLSRGRALKPRGGGCWRLKSLTSTEAFEFNVAGTRGRLGGTEAAVQSSSIGAMATAIVMKENSRMGEESSNMTQARVGLVKDILAAVIRP